MEEADVLSLFEAPQHHYTRALLSAVSTPDPGTAVDRVSFDPAAFDPGTPLREVAPGHLAAV